MVSWCSFYVVGAMFDMNDKPRWKEYIDYERVGDDPLGASRAVMITATCGGLFWFCVWLFWFS